MTHLQVTVHRCISKYSTSIIHREPTGDCCLLCARKTQVCVGESEERHKLWHSRDQLSQGHSSSEQTIPIDVTSNPTNLRDDTLIQLLAIDLCRLCRSVELPEKRRFIQPNWFPRCSFSINRQRTTPIKMSKHLG